MSRVLNIKDYNYKVPEGAIYIGRAMPRYNLSESKWANPYRIGKDGTRLDVLKKYSLDILFKHENCIGYDFKELEGKDLACWCYPQPCHGDILLRLANPFISTTRGRCEQLEAFKELE